MKLASIGGRAHLIERQGGFDIAAADSRLPSHMRTLLDHLDELRAWKREARPELDRSLSEGELLQNPVRLDAPLTDPEQIFAIGLNYRGHVAETGRTVPDKPVVFTKFVSALTGPGGDIPLPDGTVDWEVELVVVIGRPGRNIAPERAGDHVAGYCIGQDISERTLQFSGSPAQFSLGKSHEGFAPLGPWITTADEVDAGNLDLECRVGEEVLQQANTSQMIFNVAALVSYLSSVCELRTGDLIFSGTPDGVGAGRKPPRFLGPGMLLQSSITGLGNLSNRCVPAGGVSA